jgi:hypothetical protein
MKNAICHLSFSVRANAEILQRRVQILIYSWVALISVYKKVTSGYNYRGQLSFLNWTC